MVEGMGLAVGSGEAGWDVRMSSWLWHIQG